MIRTIAKITVVFVAAALLFGCTDANRAFKQSTYNYNNTQYRMNRAQKANDAQAPTVVKKAGYYVNTTPIDISNNPTWMQRTITLQANDLPLSFLVKQILRDTNAVVSYQPGMNASTPISMNYRGTIKGALDSLALKTNYSYTVDNGEITWSNFITKTFNISFMPGSSDYMLGQDAGKTNTNSSDNDISTMKGNLDDAQYSSLKGSLSVWKDLANTLNDLKSKTGKVFVSESTTTVTVHDCPANVRAMAQYIKQLNREMSRQVQLKVRVLQVNLDKSHQYGIDWNLVNKYFSFAANVSNTLDTSDAGTIASPVQFILGKNASNSAILHAISEQGRVRIVTEPTAITMNNQVAEIRITRDTAYLKKIEQTNTGGSSNFSTTSLDPGIVTDGFALYLLPKIQDNKVFLTISSSTSTLEKIDTINSAGQTNSASNDSGTTIQVPTLAEKRFNMKSALQNGQTLVIGGFKQLEDKTKQTAVFGSTKLGGRSVLQRNIETIILITPTIIENK